MLSRATYTTRAQCQLPRQAPSAAGSASVNHNLVPTQMTGNNTPISGPQLERLPAETLIGGGASHPPQQPEQQLSLRAVSAIEQLKYQFPVNPIRFRDIAWRFKQLPTHWQERALDYRMGKPDLNSLDHAARQADYEHWWTDGLTEEQRRWHGRVRHLVEDMTMAAETTQVEHATMLQHIAHLQVYITRETEPALFQALTDFRVLHDGIPLPLHHADFDPLFARIERAHFFAQSDQRPGFPNLCRALE